MSIIKQLGQTTGRMAKQAFNQETFNGYDPFNARWRPSHASTPDLSQYMQNYQAPQQAQAAQAAPAGPKPQAQPDTGGLDEGTLGNSLGYFGATPHGFLFNAAWDGASHLMGGGPTSQQIDNAYGKYTTNIGKDSLGTSAGKLFNGVGMSLSNPITAARRIGGDFAKGLGQSRDFKWLSNRFGGGQQAAAPAQPATGAANPYMR